MASPFKSWPPLPSVNGLTVLDEEWGEWSTRSWYLRRSTDNLIVFLHGGGDIKGTPGCHPKLLATLCSQSSYAVMEPEQRLAPRYGFQERVDWLVRFLKFMRNGCVHFNLKLYLVGSSSGAALAMNVARACSKWDVRVDKLVLLVPRIATGPTARHWREHVFSPGMNLGEISGWENEAYQTQTEADAANLLNMWPDKVESLPPMLIYAAELDHFLPETKEWFRMLKRTGRDCDEFEVAPEMPHKFLLMSEELRAGPTYKQFERVRDRGVKFSTS